GDDAPRAVSPAATVARGYASARGRRRACTREGSEATLRRRGGNDVGPRAAAAATARARSERVVDDLAHRPALVVVAPVVAPALRPLALGVITEPVVSRSLRSASRS